MRQEQREPQAGQRVPVDVASGTPGRRGERLVAEAAPDVAGNGSGHLEVEDRDTIVGSYQHVEHVQVAVYDTALVYGSLYAKMV